MLIAVFPLLVAVIGLVLYFTTEKAKEPGRIMFAVGLLVLTWLLAGHTVALR